MVDNQEWRAYLRSLLTGIRHCLQDKAEMLADAEFNTDPGLFTMALDQVQWYVRTAETGLELILKQLEYYPIAPKEEEDDE